ncbi:unnamed protein product, partial [Musa textilis]
LHCSVPVCTCFMTAVQERTCCNAGTNVLNERTNVRAERTNEPISAVAEMLL